VRKALALFARLYEPAVVSILTRRCERARYAVNAEMRLRTAATIMGALAIVVGSFWITLTALRHMDAARAPASVQTAPSTVPATTTPAANAGATATRVTPGSFNVGPGSALSEDADKLLTTSPASGTYALTAPVPFPPFSAGPGKIRVRLQLLEGQLSILIDGRNGEKIVEKPVEITSQPIQVVVDLADVAKARQIVLRNIGPNGSSARARIFYIEGVL
jgi:hypothetical protein